MSTDEIFFPELDKVKLIIFDFDNTIIDIHTNGSCLKSDTNVLRENINPFFKDLLKYLLNKEFKVGVASFSDKRYVEDNDYLVGKDLIREFFVVNFGLEVADKILIESFDPGFTFRKDFKKIPKELYQSTINKNIHIRNIVAKLENKIDYDHVLFFDDSRKNIDNLIPECNGFLVNKKNKFNLRLWNMATELFRNNVKNNMITLTIN